MTDLKIQTNPPEGAGFTHGLLDELYDQRTQHRHIDYVVVQGLMKISGHGENDTKNGTKRHVKGEFVRLEPVRDPAEAEDVAWQITRSYERRTTPQQPGQTELLLSNSPAEKKRSLLEELREWAEAHEVSEEELDERLVVMLGGEQHATSLSVKNASLVHLIEFVGFTTQEDKQSKVPMPDFSDETDEAEGSETDGENAA